MTSFESKLSAAERVVLAIDTADEQEAEKLAELAKTAGARYIKFGLQLATAKSWDWCARLAAKYHLEWIADAKLDDIPNTIEASIGSLLELSQPPYAITIHASAGRQAMKRAQVKAGSVKIFCVTVLTSLGDDEARQIYGAPVQAKVIELASMAADAGVAGIVASPQEVALINKKSNLSELITLIPGTRSEHAQVGDQARVTTPSKAIKAGADLLVIGREITQANDPAQAFNKIIKNVEGAINA